MQVYQSLKLEKSPRNQLIGTLNFFNVVFTLSYFFNFLDHSRQSPQAKTAGRWALTAVGTRHSVWKFIEKEKTHRRKFVAKLKYLLPFEKSSWNVLLATLKVDIKTKMAAAGFPLACVHCSVLSTFLLNDLNIESESADKINSSIPVPKFLDTLYSELSVNSIFWIANGRRK